VMAFWYGIENNTFVCTDSSRMWYKENITVSLQ
jgi:hypothetical protein